MKGKIALAVSRGPQGQGILRVEGSVDPTTFKQFEAAFQEFDKRDVRYLVLDLTLLTYISSSGLSLLIKAKIERAQKNGDVVLVRPQTPIVNIMSVLGLINLFRV